ncbi:MAG: hypothetical protein RR620_08510 [Clostridium sp.]
MISAKQIFKAGRETKIFELKDDLMVNDFYNETGYQYSKLHGKMSRLSMILVDVTKGKKDKAVVLKFCFTADEWRDLRNILGAGSMNFEQACSNYSNTSFYGFVKANKYKSYGDGFIEVKRIKISYEKNMKSPSKWKIALSTGKARPSDGEGFGYQTNTYVDINSANCFLNDAEINEMIRATDVYLPLWEQHHFPIFLKYREEFMMRAKANNYDENNMSWNNSPNRYENSNTEDNSSVNNNSYNSNSSNNFNDYNEFESYNTNNNYSAGSQNNSNQFNDANSFGESQSNNSDPFANENGGFNSFNNTNVNGSNGNCSACNATVDSKVAMVSQKRFGKVLCHVCMRK